MKTLAFFTALLISRVVFAACLTLPSTATNWWSGNDTYLDSAGANDGKIEGTGSIAFPAAKVGKGFDFTGSTSLYVNCDEVSAVGTSFTLEMWVKPTTTHDIDIEYGDPGSSDVAGTEGQNYALWPPQGDCLYSGNCLVGPFEATVGVSVGTNGISVYEHAGNWMPAMLVYEAAISDANYTHIAVTVDDQGANTEYELYVNGSSVDTRTRSNADGVTLHPGIVGGYFFGDVGGIGGGSFGYFIGYVDEVLIHNDALSAAAISNIYSADTDGYCKTQSPTIAIDTSTVAQTLNHVPMIGLNIFTPGSVGVKRSGDLYSGDDFASLAAFAATNPHQSQRPMIRMTFPMDRLKYDRALETIDFSQGLYPVAMYTCPGNNLIAATDTLAGETYDAGLGLDDFMDTVFTMKVDAYMTVETVPRQPTSDCRQGGPTPELCLASDQGDFSPAYAAAATNIRWNISSPANYTQWASLLNYMIRHFHQIEWWSIGNEPNEPLGYFWDPTDASSFYTFYNESAEAFAPKVRADTKIGGYGDPCYLSCNDAFPSATWVPAFLSQLPATSPMDFMSVHRYSCDPREVFRTYENTRTYLDDAGYTSAEVVIEEFGRGTTGALEACPSNDIDNDPGDQWQAAYVATVVNKLLAEGVDMFFFWNAAGFASATNALVNFTSTADVTCPDNNFTDYTLTEFTPLHQVFQFYSFLHPTVVTSATTAEHLDTIVTSSPSGRDISVLSVNFDILTRTTSLDLTGLAKGTYAVWYYDVDNTDISLGASGVSFSGLSWDLLEGVRIIKSYGAVQPATKEIKTVRSGSMSLSLTMNPFTVHLVRIRAVDL